MTQHWNDIVLVAGLSIWLISAILLAWAAVRAMGDTARAHRAQITEVGAFARMLNASLTGVCEEMFRHSDRAVHAQAEEHLRVLKLVMSHLIVTDPNSDSALRRGAVKDLLNAGSGLSIEPATPNPISVGSHDKRKWRKGASAGMLLQTGRPPQRIKNNGNPYDLQAADEEEINKMTEATADGDDATTDSEEGPGGDSGERGSAGGDGTQHPVN